MAESGFRRIRPFKVIAVVMTFVALVLTIISLAGPDWVSVTFYGGQAQSWGLWWECFKVQQSFELCVSSDWLKACTALVFISLIAEIAIMACAFWGLYERKRLAYVIAGSGCIVATVFLVITLIVFPVKFTDEVKNDPGYRSETSEFLFDWTYGLAWAAVCFLIGAAIFFFIKVEEEQEAQPMKSAYGAGYDNSFWSGQNPNKA